MSRDIIKLDQIDVTFHQKKRTITAVKDVTIHIQEGDIYGIVGYSGAGKSTLVRVINLLQKPSAGKITIDDDVIFDDKVTLTAEQLRRKRQDIPECRSASLSRLNDTTIQFSQDNLHLTGKEGKDRKR